MKTMSISPNSENERNKTFSQLFLDAIVINKLVPTPEGSPIGYQNFAEHIISGHGPFVKLSDGSIKYDFYENKLLGHTHPLELKRIAAQKLNLMNENDESQSLVQVMEQYFPEFGGKYVYKIQDKQKLFSHNNLVVSDESKAFGRCESLLDAKEKDRLHNVDALYFSDPFDEDFIVSKIEINGLQTAGQAYKADLFSYICKGNFQGPHGKIKEIAELFKTHLPQNMGIEINGLKIKIKVPKSSEKLLEKLFKDGLILKKAGDEINIDLPLSLTGNHIFEIAKIYKENLG